MAKGHEFKIDKASISPSISELGYKLQSNSFIRSRWFDEWCHRATKEASIGLIAEIALAINFVFGHRHSEWTAHRTLKRIVANKDSFRDEANAQIIEAVIQANTTLFDTIEKYPLTPRQREAAASDDDATLVIAGAGTGKTSTILAKMGLLLNTGQCQPSEILAISYTNKSAEELKARAQEKLGVETDIHTFHKLGQNIITQGEGGKPKLAPFADDPDEKSKHLDKIIEKLLIDGRFQKQLVNFLAYHHLPVKQQWSFSSLAEYKAWLQSNQVCSLDGVPKKSYQECVIANWLLMNGVRFIYEDQYEHDTRTLEYRQYCPDFHLIDTGIYLEHFGVDEKNVPAPYINATQYQKSMEWKREIHRKHQTKMVETFSWEHSKGILLSNLEMKLMDMGCKFEPISEQAALEMINKSGIISGFAEILGMFLTLYKGNGSKLRNSDIRNAIFEYQREREFLKIFDSILAEYESQNQCAKQIDFEDMIMRAATLVKEGRFNSQYKYILVDEFQDISPGRAELINALQHAVPDCALFCVGDDWQSIYRFTGSDIGAMTHFHSIFGTNRRVSLDTTFRFDNYAIETSSRFVQKNPAQIRKNLRAVKPGSGPSVVLYKRRSVEAPLDWSLAQISEHAKGSATVLVLERYNFHLPDAQEQERLRLTFPNLLISTMSVHGSKGLEADYVIVGLRGGKWGFPATKPDDPLMEMVLTQADEYPYGEERRLFYVALTRARHKTFLVCETGQDQSPFSAELESEKEYGIEVFGVDTKKLACAKCQSGTMLLRDGANGKFYGCSNYPLCYHTQQTCSQCRIGLLIHENGRQWVCNHCAYKARLCPRCRMGVLLKKSGTRGPFLGCSNYQDPEINCRYTEDGH